MAKILIIEDNVTLAENVFLHLKNEGQYVLKVHSCQEGLAQMERYQPEIIITDLLLGDGTGLDILNASRVQKNLPDVILATAHPTPETATQAMNAGAYEYLTKPYELSEVSTIIQRIIKRRELVKERGKAFQSKHKTPISRKLIVENAKMKSIMQTLRQAAPRNTTIMLLGESGTGKEELAHFIHRHGPNPEGPFVGINCGAIPENLVASELFGHEKGAFTGATTTRQGAFVQAHNGTLLLDEIGDIPQTIQVHLLRLLENREVTPVGGVQTIPVNVRLIAATHRNLEKLIAEGTFREDLFFRLNVFPISIPPLRERLDEIPALVEFFLQQLCYSKKSIGEEVNNLLKTYHWPGNIRELRNVVENLIIRSQTDQVSLDLAETVMDSLKSHPIPIKPGNDRSETLAEIEMREISEVLKRVDGNRTKAASLLGISRTKLYSRIKQLGLEEKENATS